MARQPRSTSQQRQAGLIAAAASLFAAKGFNGTTTKEIAKAAGVSEALVFKHFPTKRALYGAILAEKVTVDELLEAVEESARKRDDRRVFTLIASFRIRPGVDSTFLRLLLFSALEGHELSDMFFGKHHRVFYDHLATYIETRIGEGAFREVDPLLAARAFIGMVVHHRLLHEIFGVPMHRSHDETVATYVDLFFAGLMNKSCTETGLMNPVRQHPIVTLGVIIFFAVTALVVFRLSSGAKIDQKKSRVITVGTVTPLKQDLDIRLAYTADITPNQVVNIFSRVDGYIAKLYVDKGDLVKANQLLVEIDHHGLSACGQPGKSQPRRSKSQGRRSRTPSVRNAKLTLDRMQALIKDQFVSQQDLDNAQVHLRRRGGRCSTRSARKSSKWKSRSLRPRQTWPTPISARPSLDMWPNGTSTSAPM